MCAKSKKILLSESRLDLLLEYEIERRLYPFARKIYNDVVNDSQSGEEYLRYEPNELAQYGINASNGLYIRFVHLGADGKNFASYWTDGYGKFTISVNIDNIQRNGSQVMSKICHELAHVIKDSQNDRNVSTYDGGESGAGGYAKNLVYLYSEHEMNARAQETISYVYHNPRTFLDLINRSLNGDNLYIDKVTEQALDMMSGITEFYVMNDYLNYIKSRDSYEQRYDSVIRMLSTDKNGFVDSVFEDVFNGKIRDKEEYERAKEALIESMLKKNHEFYDFIFISARKILAKFVQMFFQGGSQSQQRGQQQTNGQQNNSQNTNFNNNNVYSKNNGVNNNMQQ